jgi:hypothetical protein
MTSTSTPRGANRRLRILQLALVASLLGVIVIASVVLLRTADTGVDSQTGVVPSEVERFSPIPGSTVRPQETVSVDLRDGLTGDLIIDGVIIPVDQTDQIPELGTIAFRPGPDREFETFGPGQHAVTIRWRPVQAPPDQVDGSFSWTFGVA